MKNKVSALIAAFGVFLLQGCSVKISEAEAIQIAGSFLEENGYPPRETLEIRMVWKDGAWQGTVRPVSDSDFQNALNWPIYIEVTRNGKVSGLM